MWNKPSKAKKITTDTAQSKLVYAYPARLSRYCRTREIQETKILGKTYWEAHLQENKLWCFNRVDILADVLEGERVELRKVKTLSEGLTFFEVIQKLATYELNQPNPLAKMVGKNRDELAEQHYIYAAEQEGWIIFNHRGQPKFAPNGHVQDQGTYIESHIKRAKERAEAACEKYPHLFKDDVFDIKNKPVVQKQESQVQKKLPSIGAQKQQLLAEITPLAEVFNQKNTPTIEADTYHYIKHMDLMVADLKKFKDYLRRLQTSPNGYEVSMFLPWDHTHVSLADKHFKAAQKHALNAVKTPEQKENFTQYFNKLELDFYIFMGRSWHDWGVDSQNVGRVKKMKSQMKKYISKIQKMAKKYGITEMDSQALELTLFTSKPRVPDRINEFITKYKDWHRQKIQELQRPETQSVKVISPKR